MKPLISPSPLPHLIRLVWIDHVLADVLEHLPENGSLEIKTVNGNVQREARKITTILTAPRPKQDKP